ncbi:MAG: DUF3536 domain-containing protein [Candidatus Atribacteria bacterium]|nr:MAG: DUF3536 domain-containing protein [Candidatus Atribacteria bacterium]
MRVAVHYAVSSLFRDYSEHETIYTYETKRLVYDRMELGKQRLAIGRALVRSTITLEKNEVSFAVLHHGDHNIIGGAREYTGEEAFSQMHDDIHEKFMRGELSEVILRIDKHFKTHNYSLWHLFKNEQREIIYQIFAQARTETENAFRQLYEHHYPIMLALEGLNIPLPKYFSSILEFVVNTDIRSFIENGESNYDKLQRLVHEAKHWSIEFDRPQISLIVTRRIDACMEDLSTSPDNLLIMQQVINLLKTMGLIDLKLDLWRSQNIYFSIGKRLMTEMQKQAATHKTEAQDWLKNFALLGDYLKVRIG